jgi:S1-C subfamily serine protease
MKRCSLVFIFLLIILLGIIPSPRADKIYKWVDEKGVVHFSDHAPDQAEKTRGNVEERDLTDFSSNPKGDAPALNPSERSPVEHAASCTFTIKGAKRIGSGFLVASNGYAVTCRHVVEEPGTYVALLSDQNEYPLNVISLSYGHDLAIVQVAASQKMPFLSLRDAKTLVAGERVFAIGASAGLNATVTDGVFTGFRHIPQDEENLIQFSAPVNPGNSGGPLIDEKAQVVGVVSMKFVSQKGIPISGVGFAIPSSDVEGEFGTYLEQNQR